MEHIDNNVMKSEGHLGNVPNKNQEIYFYLRSSLRLQFNLITTAQYSLSNTVVYY
jgi:hypothetical protein